MADKPPRSPQPSKEERLAKALRENLARRKALVRAKRDRPEADRGGGAVRPPQSDDAAS